MTLPTVNDLGREAAVGTVALVPTIGVVALLLSLLGVPSAPADAMAAGIIVGVVMAFVFLTACEVVQTHAPIAVLRGGRA